MLIDEKSRPVDKYVMTLAAYSIQGRRNHMEDFFDIGYQLKHCDQRRPNEWPYEYFYFGIFDGHGGREAAKFAKENLLKFITQQSDFWSNDDEDIKRAIRNGFAETHSAMRQSMSQWARTSKVLPSTAGTTASVLFIRNGKFYTGHVGDSRIVIAQENPETKNWISHQLTDDHKPESKQEMDRIRRAGGDVKSKLGVYRVVWKRPVLVNEMEEKINCGPDTEEFDSYLEQTSTYPVEESLVDSYQVIPFLAIARSLGDFWSLNPYSGQYIVSPEPDVDCRPINPNDKCILLATDGLWNVINSAQAIRMLQELNMRKKGDSEHYDDYFAIDNFYDAADDDSENYAQSLVYFAYQTWERRRLRSDNITVVVSMLHDILFHCIQKPSKAYATRASLQLEKKQVERVPEPSILEPVQVGPISIFMEKLVLDQAPTFYHDKSSQAYDQAMWRGIENFLLLPPTLLEQEHIFLKYPANYFRLSIARCRKISHLGLRDSYIYIKRVSDDPADRERLPSRRNKSGKRVRDASAQATQSMHDFGQPWDQLLESDSDDAHYYDMNDAEEYVIRDEDSIVACDDDEDKKVVWGSKGKRDESELIQKCLKLFRESNLRSSRTPSRSSNENDSDRDDDDDDDDDAEHNDGDGVDNDEGVSDDHDLIADVGDIDSDDINDSIIDDDDDDDADDDDNHQLEKPQVKDSPETVSIPQLRCLLNSSSHRRITRRSAYLSMSENAKRKTQLLSDGPKSKRRRSQPVRCNLSQF